MASLSEILSRVSAGLQGAASGDVEVTISSAVAPPITVRPLDQGDGSPSSPSWALRLLRPKIVVVSGGVEVATVAPAGEPPDVPWVGIAAGVAVVGAGVVIFFAGRALK